MIESLPEMRMKMQKALKYYLSAMIMAAVGLVYILLVKVVDVRAIGPMGSTVGFAAINGAVFNFFGVSKFWDVITDLIAGVALLTAVGFAGLGIYQLIREKSFKEVDTSFYVLAGLYVALLIVYIFFDKVWVINYRPVLEDGALEASFPSSHTILVLVVMLSAITMTDRLYEDNKLILMIVDIVAVLCAVIMVIGRLVSGVHWFTDIIGAVIISAALLSVFKGTLRMLDDKEAMKA